MEELTDVTVTMPSQILAVCLHVALQGLCTSSRDGTSVKIEGASNRLIHKIQCELPKCLRANGFAPPIKVTYST